jgi:hypothetical protein
MFERREGENQSSFINLLSVGGKVVFLKDTTECD